MPAGSRRVRDGVVAARVVPHVGQRANAQRADVGVGVVAHQRRDLPAVHRFADVAFDERRAIGGEPAVALGVGKLRHAGAAMADGQPGGGPLFFAAGDGLVDPRLDRARSMSSAL